MHFYIQLVVLVVEQTLVMAELVVHLDKVVLVVLEVLEVHLVTLVETVALDLAVIQVQLVALVETETLLTGLVDHQDLAEVVDLAVVLEVQPVITFIIVHQ